MSHIDGQIGTIDLADLHPSDYFKIGVAHGEQGWTLDSAYVNQPAYLEGYAFGKAMSPYLFNQPRDVPITEEEMINVPPKIGASLAGLGTGSFDGHTGILRGGTPPDDFEETFTWNAALNKWTGRPYTVISTDDAWALDMSRQAIARFQNQWARFNGGVSWYRNGLRGVLRSPVTLPAASIPVSIFDGVPFPTSGQVLIRDQLVTYTGYTATPGAEALTGASGGTGTFPANLTPVIPYGSTTGGGDFGGFGTTVIPMDHVGEMWAAGFRLQERANTWINGSQDNFAMSVAPYYLNYNLNADFNYPDLSSAPSGGLGMGVTLTGPALPLAINRGVERDFQWRSSSWTDWVASAPTSRILVPILYGKMPAGAQDNGEVYGYTLSLRWIG